MLEVDLITNCRDPLERQLPGGDPVHHGVRFHLQRQHPASDICVVYHDVKYPCDVTCSSGLAVLITVEPEILKSFYPQAFLDQFDVVLTFRRDLKHPSVHHCPPMVPWWVGVSGGHEIERTVNLTYDDLARPLDPADKTHACSVIASSLAYTDSHRQRLAFVEALCARQPAIDRFGFGHRPIDDKWLALRDYRVHIGIENSNSPDYWTEKAADAFLSECFLVYWGCPNLSDYFPEQAFTRIDLNDVDSALELVEQASDERFYHERRPAILEAKRLVLERHNLFSMLAEKLPTLTPTGQTTRRIKPQDWYRGSLRKRLRNRLTYRFRSRSRPAASY
ncbi:MAG: glycosyltransferase family 10 [Planctomycetota bacterium]